MSKLTHEEFDRQVKEALEKAKKPQGGQDMLQRLRELKKGTTPSQPPPV